MPNALSPSLTGPPWFPSMTFPSTWYHPVYAARVIETAADLATLDWTWSPDPGIACPFGAHAAGSCWVRQ